MKTIETMVYMFDELSESAKERARAWYREGALDYEWHDSILDEVRHIAGLMGIYIDKIYFSGFVSQGDGAMFTGSYSYRKGGVKEVEEYAPLDSEVISIARNLANIQKKYFYRLSASCEHKGRYFHEYCMSVNVYDDGRYNATREAEDGITEELRGFARWIYRRLEDEYEYLNSDETVEESIRANEYEFYEDGGIA